MLKATDVANFFIDVVNKTEDDQITNLKLNKLLYYAQGCFLGRTGRRLFEENIEAWPLGPVVPSVYHKYKVCGRSPIETVEDNYSPDVFNDEELTALIDVMREYGQYTGATLVSKTHEEGTPWKEAVDNGDTVISTKSIHDFFQQHPIRSIDDLLENIPIVRKLPADWYNPDEDGEWEAYF